MLPGVGRNGDRRWRGRFRTAARPGRDGHQRSVPPQRCHVDVRGVGEGVNCWVGRRLQAMGQVAGEPVELVMAWLLVGRLDSSVVNPAAMDRNDPAGFQRC